MNPTISPPAATPFRANVDACYSRLTPVSRRLIDYILANPDKAAAATSGQLAAAVGCSHDGPLRLAHALGYRSFVEMRYAVRYGDSPQTLHDRDPAVSTEVAQQTLRDARPPTKRSTRDHTPRQADAETREQIDALTGQVAALRAGLATTREKLAAAEVERDQARHDLDQLRAKRDSRPARQGAAPATDTAAREAARSAYDATVGPLPDECSAADAALLAHMDALVMVVADLDAALRPFIQLDQVKPDGKTAVLRATITVDYRLISQASGALDRLAAWRFADSHRRSGAGLPRKAA